MDANRIARFSALSGQDFERIRGPVPAVEALRRLGVERASR